MENAKSSWSKKVSNTLAYGSLGVSFCIAAVLYEDNDFFTRRLPNNAEKELSVAPCLENSSSCAKRIRLSDQYSLRTLIQRDDFKMPPLFASEFKIYDTVDSAIRRDFCYERTVFIGHEETGNAFQVIKHPSPCKS